MPSRYDRQATPADLVALAMRVQQDERTGRGDRLAQSAALQARLLADPNPPTTDADRLLWLIDQADDQPATHCARQARAALSLVGLIVAAIGLLSGAALASAIFYYDGNAPVNVVAVLGVFVVLQTLLLLLAVLTALPRGWVRWLPGADGVQEALRLASPGRVALLGARLLPQDLREALSAAIGRAGAHQRVFGRVQLWAILRWSQLYAAALNLAAVATFLYLVAFSDLAFGWSTTLSLSPDAFHRITQTIALPWAWNDALTPSTDLIERSRHYRGTDFDPTSRGDWWPFLLTAMLIYGLLPRVIALVIASIRLRQATRLALVSIPGAQELLQQLQATPTATKTHDADAASPIETPQPVALGNTPIVIDWSRAAGTPARASALLGVEPASFEPAGGSRSVEDDQRTIEAIGQRVNGDGVAIMVKLWEPPVIETTDFLKALRRAIGERLPVRVVPVASDTDGRVIGDDPVLAEQWRRRVDAIGDPWTRVAEPVGLTAPQAERADG